MDNNNLILAVILSVLIMVGFQYFVVKPQQETVHQQAISRQMASSSAPVPAAPVVATFRDRMVVIAEGQRLPIHTPELSGSLNLKGARFDDLELSQYRETVDAQSPNIILLSPAGARPPHSAYYAEFSWLAADPAIAVPTSETVWQKTASDSAPLSDNHPVTLRWDNGHGLVFTRTIQVDEQAMFTVTDSVVNKSGADVTLYPYGVVARQGVPQLSQRSTAHEGPLGVFNGTLEEFTYKKLVESGKKAFQGKGGWLGITDKYWLVAMIPDQKDNLTTEIAHNAAVDPNLPGWFQTDYRGGAVTLAAGASTEHVEHLFAGAKRVKLLESYASRYDIPHFDRAIDFGWFYFLTKPFLYLLAWLASVLGGVAPAILVLTVLLRTATLPLSLKSFHSMSRMKALQPEIKRIQEKYADDKMRQSQEMMELYKREKVNPVSGCVPTLLQIPIFFALYKVLYVNLEMRQAPFYGWISDMSVPDPTSVFTLFGLIPWDPPMALHIGIWPILMGASMLLQQKLSPQPPDKTQAKMFMLMPIIFTYMLSQMPAGLVIYWTWSNLLGITQQWIIQRRDLKPAE